MPGKPLGDRMKAYEAGAGSQLSPRMPVVLRVDGKAFHTLTRGFEKPFDEVIAACMERVAMALCEQIGTAKLAYGQSDEVSVLLVDYAKLGTQQWFGGRRSKMESVAASIATAAFNEGLYDAWLSAPPDDVDRVQFLRSKLFHAQFDARVFPVPEPDVANYFLWRQQDAVRNSVLSAGQAVMSHRELHGMGCGEIRSALAEASRPWEGIPVRHRHGYAVSRLPLAPGRTAWAVDGNLPDFGEDRGYVERWLETEE